MTWTVLDLGPLPHDGVERWGGDPRIDRVIRVENPAPSGRRFGSRALGLGADALRVALRARLRSRPNAVIAMNPWTAVCAKVIGLRKVCVVGLYAIEGGRSWQLLRTVLRSSPVVTLSRHEAERWRAAGGRARAVRYGATFASAPVASSATTSARLNIFVGGSSDRDRSKIAELAEAVEASQDARLVVAAGGDRESDSGRVRYCAALSSADFSAEVERSDIVFLPLSDNGRAAGHMVLVEALQRGKPVVATWVAGMNEYFDGDFVRQAEADLLPQLRDTAARFATRSDAVKDYWRSDYSKAAFAARILDALEEMS